VLHHRRRRLPAADGASRPCIGGDDPDGGCGGLSFARIAFNGASRGESGVTVICFSQPVAFSDAFLKLFGSAR